MSRRKSKLKEVVPKLRHVYAYFWPDIRPYRRRIATSMFALLVSVALRLLEPWPLKFFLDFVLGDQSGVAHPWGLTSPQLLLLIAVATVAIVVCRAFADYSSRVGFFVVGNRVVIKVRDRLYRHLQDLSLAYHSRARTGDLIIRVTRDVSLLRDVTATAMLPLIASTAVLLGMVTVMLFLSWQLTLLALLTLPLFWLTTLRLGKQIRDSARRQRQRKGAMATTASEAMGAIQVIKAMGLEERFARLFNQRNAAGQKEDLKASRLSLRLGRTVDILLAISSALVIWFGGRLVLAGQMSAGDIIVFLAYLKRSFKPAQEFAKYVARLAKAATAGERVIEILEKTPAIGDPPDAAELQNCAGQVAFRNVCFEFEAGQPVLQDVSFQAEAGELVCFVGPSGSGKTTTLSHVLRLFDPQSGAVTFDGQEIQKFTRASIRSQTSSVMQDALLLADSVRENIACAVDEATDEQVVAAAKMANAYEFIMRMPGGFQAKIGERGATLSRGQRQRIAIARAAMRQAPILLLDEPTVGLDEDSEGQVVDALLKLAQGRTTLLVTHNLSLASRADRIYFVDAGRIVESGTHEELMGKQRRYARWFSEQQRRRNKTATKLSYRFVKKRVDL